MEELDHMWQVVTKFGKLRIDKRGDTGMSFDATHHYATCKKLTGFSSLCIVTRTHHYGSTVNDFDTNKFGHNLLHDPIIQNINFIHLS